MRCGNMRRVGERASALSGQLKAEADEPAPPARFSANVRKRLDSSVFSLWRRCKRGTGTVNNNNNEWVTLSATAGKGARVLNGSKITRGRSQVRGKRQSKRAQNQSLPIKLVWFTWTKPSAAPTTSYSTQDILYPARSGFAE